MHIDMCAHIYIYIYIYIYIHVYAPVFHTEIRLLGGGLFDAGLILRVRGTGVHILHLEGIPQEFSLEGSWRGNLWY